MAVTDPSQTRHVLDEAKLQIGTKRPGEGDAGIKLEEQTDAAKDQVDDALPKGPKKADASTGGRVQVAETGDLKQLAAERNS